MKLRWEAWIKKLSIQGQVHNHLYKFFDQEKFSLSQNQEVKKKKYCVHTRTNLLPVNMTIFLKGKIIFDVIL